MNKQRTEDFCGSEIILVDTIRFDTCHYMFVKSHKMNPRQNPNANYEL